jgi:hypothetical protein
MLDEIAHTIERLRKEFDALAVRGLRAAAPADLAVLRAAGEEFERIGAAHLAERIQGVIRGIETGDAGAAAALLQAQTSLRLFDRVLTLDLAAATLGTLCQADDEEDA